MSMSCDASMMTFRIGPIYLAFDMFAYDGQSASREAASAQVALCIPSEHPIHAFSISEASVHAVHVQTVITPELPSIPNMHAYGHRAGWNVFCDGTHTRAFKEMPFGSGHVVRVIERTGAESMLRLLVHPDDPQIYDPCAYTGSEVMCMMAMAGLPATLIHAAAVVPNDSERALVFCGPSGSGKSTMAGLWAAHDAGVVLGDESLLLWRDDSGAVMASGTPWPGSSGIYSQMTARVERLFFIEHGMENAAYPFDATMAQARLCAGAFLPLWDECAVAPAVDALEALAQTGGVFRLPFLPDESVLSFLRG